MLCEKNNRLQLFTKQKSCRLVQTESICSQKISKTLTQKFSLRWLQKIAGKEENGV